jgi:transmembrane sensor
MSGLERLGQTLADEQDALLEQHDDLGPVRERLLARAAAPAKKRQKYPLALAAAALALLALVALVFRLRSATEPLRFTVGAARTPGVVGQWLSAGAADKLSVEFSDGTHVAFGPSARARIVTLERSGAGIVVESGRAEFVVIPKQGAIWKITLGPFAVNVTGTRFSVDWDPEAQLLVLALDEGRVSVSGCVFGDGRPVLAGETVRASCKEGRIEITSADATRHSQSARIETPPASQPASPGPVARTPHTLPEKAAMKLEHTQPSLPAPPDWRTLAERGDYRGAFGAADAAGFEKLCQSVSAAELLLLGDSARFSGQLAKAEHAYLTLRARFAADSRAPVAAFMLARISSDQRASSSQAARWLETYLAEQPSGPLGQEALGRLIEARERTGNHIGAQRAARDYIARYPAGPHAELAQRLLAE